MSDTARFLHKNTLYGKSRLVNSVVWEHLSGTDANIACAAAAFEKESLESLSVKPIDADTRRKRREDVKAFIIKLLLFIDVYPRDKGFPLLATTLEKMSTYSIEFDDVVHSIAESMHISDGAVERLIVGQFDLAANSRQSEAIGYLTDAVPFTALDAIYDLAVYIRKVNSDTGEQYA